MKLSTVSLKLLSFFKYAFNDTYPTFINYNNKTRSFLIGIVFNIYIAFLKYGILWSNLSWPKNASPL